MTELLSELSIVGPNGLMIFALVFLRVGGAMALLPAFGEQSVPQRVRLALSLAFTMVVMPAVYSLFPSDDLRGSVIALYLLGELVAGLAIGFALRLFIIALQVAGSIAAQSTSLSQIFGGAGTDPQPVIGHILVTAGLALAVTLGLHIQIAELLIYSYSVAVPGSMLPASDLANWGTYRISQAFGLGFSIAAPFAVASLIYNVALGAINKAMPQLMVSFVGAPAITAGGLLLLAIAAPLMLVTWHQSLLIFLGRPFEIGP